MRRDDDYLRDVPVAAREALELTRGLSYADFARDRRTQLAVLRLLGIIGEAASCLSVETREKHPDIPWGEITGMRNRLVHAYFDVDLRLVWDTLRDDLPPLVDQLGHLAPPEQE